MMARVEDAGYQFLQTETGWSLYDLDDRSEVNAARAKALGDSIWAAAETLDLRHEEGEQDEPTTSSNQR